MFVCQSQHFLLTCTETSGGNTHFECDVLIDSDLTTNSILKLGDIQFHIPEDYPGSSASIAFNK